MRVYVRTDQPGALFFAVIARATDIDLDTGQGAPSCTYWCY